MDKILNFLVAKNFARLVCFGATLAFVACDSGDSSSSPQMVWENSCSSAEFIVSSGDVGLSSGEIFASSSSAEISSSSGWFKKGDFLNPDIEYGTLVDTRDGKTYSTVVIGNLTWMAENLNYADSVQDPILKGATRCIDERDEGCNALGRLYDMKIVTEIDSSKLTNKGGIYFAGDYQGICPDGWRIPLYWEWRELWMGVMHSDHILYVYDSLGVLVSRTAFDNSGTENGPQPGIDLYGFSALPLHNAVYIYSNIDLDEVGCCDNTGPILAAYNIKGVFFWRNDNVMADTQMGIVRCVKGYSVGEFRTHEDLLNPNLQYDMLVDERDGQSYLTYNGVMAENLNYDDGKAMCYGNDESKCSLFGRMYGIESLDSMSFDGLCPEGWRLPNGLWYMDEGVGWYMDDAKRNTPDFDYDEHVMPNAFPVGYFDEGEFWGTGSFFAFWGVGYGRGAWKIGSFLGDVGSEADWIDDRDNKMPIRCVEKSRYGDIDDDE